MAEETILGPDLSEEEMIVLCRQH
ncbi:hypothetical protein A2U01_0089203, partial [Trifolium medium]|nr:hypothetical protein [Trifolium medium]